MGVMTKTAGLDDRKKSVKRFKKFVKTIFWLALIVVVAVLAYFYFVNGELPF